MNDKIVLIAGGTGGIGSATARVFSEAGAITVIAGRNRSKADALVSELNEAGGEAYAVDLDVTSTESINDMTHYVTRELGRIDVLINAFGTGLIKSILDVDPEKARETVEVNVMGTINVTQSVVRQMAEQKSGKVIMFPGILGKNVMRNTSVYSASKFAVTGFTKALVEETRRFNIGFSLLFLGGVNTGFWNNEEVQMKVQTDKMLTTDEVARAVFFAANQSSPGVLNEMVLQPDSHQMV